MIFGLETHRTPTHPVVVLTPLARAALSAGRALLRRALAVCLLGAATLAAAQPLPPVGRTPYPGTLQLQVDATDLPRRILRAELTLPVRPGPLVLYYPQWLPGTHSPSASVGLLSGLQVQAAGRPLDWRRNEVDPHAFHLSVPAGVDRLDIRYEFLSPHEAANGRRVVTPEIVGLQWNSVLLYPAGHAATDIAVAASLKLPPGWQYGSALHERRRDGDLVGFEPVSVETLVDSPVFAGRHFRRIDLDPEAASAGRAPVHLNVVADDEHFLAATPEQIAVHRALVTQADRLFGHRPYAHYDFLLALSESFARIGLEHHQSSENAVRPTYFTEWTRSAPGRDLLAHEYVHSWNGKYRRPADLWTPHFNTPMRNSLLWVYEGQTQFWGHVLAARSGLLSPAAARDDLAIAAAWLDLRSGRQWRNLQDTTNEPLTGRRLRADWRSQQRGADYYDEMRLVWLEADMLIREGTQDKRSMDDLARAFFAAGPGSAAKPVVPSLYRFDDVVQALQAVYPHDWAGFLRDRLDGHGPRAPLGGLERAGWRLVFTEQPTEHQRAMEAQRRIQDLTHSIGITVASGMGREAKIEDVVWGGPAFEAGIAPGGTLLAVNGRSYTAQGLRDAITAARGGNPLALLVKSGELYQTWTLEYRGGLRYPRLERVEGRPDRLSALFAPR
jgi:predicted metalloprotease with PDZ domain